MSTDEGTREFDHGARRLQGAMLEHPNLAIDRMPGLSFALDRFIVEAPARLAPLIARPSGATIEEIRATTLFEAIGECSGLTAAIYASAEPEAQLMIALDERIDSLIVASIFGEADGAGGPDRQGSEAQKPRTMIEASLVEAFARALGEALEAAFASVARVALSFERLTTIKDSFALGRRDGEAAAARFTLGMNEAPARAFCCCRRPFCCPFAPNSRTIPRLKRCLRIGAGPGSWRPAFSRRDCR